MSEFGATLKKWRQVRRLSQMDLALQSGVSARHVSFMETGRSHPSRGMVLRLCDELDLPFSARNQMLMAAGLSPSYAERDLSDADMRPVQEAMRWSLDRHAPYPGIALGRHWQLLDLNRPAERLLGVLGIKPGDNMIEVLARNPLARAALVNFDEVVTHLLARLRAESAHFGRDATLDSLIAQLSELEVDQTKGQGVRPAFLPAIYRFGDLELSLFSTISQFGSAEDIALSEMRIELMFPADEPTRLALLALDQP
jgi:transcriptional regulator with XRE-family HTH domain